MQNQTVRSVTVRGNIATIECPFCKLKKAANVSRFKKLKGALRVKCVCKDIFRVRLVFSQDYKTISQSSGKITNLSQSSRGCEVTISNMTGTSVELMIKSSQSVRKGDKLRLEYSNGNSRRKLTKKLTARLVKGKKITGFFTR